MTARPRNTQCLCGSRHFNCDGVSLRLVLATPSRHFSCSNQGALRLRGKGTAWAGHCTYMLESCWLVVFSF